MSSTDTKKKYNWNYFLNFDGKTYSKENWDLTCNDNIYTRISRRNKTVSSNKGERPKTLFDEADYIIPHQVDCTVKEDRNLI